MAITTPCYPTEHDVFSMATLETVIDFMVNCNRNYMIIYFSFSSTRKREFHHTGKGKNKISAVIF